MEALLPGTPQIVEMHERVRARQMEDYRQERARALETGLREARKLQMAGALEEAIASCNTLSAEFPGVSSIENLKAIVQQELSAKSRGELLETLLKEARGIIWDRRLSEAVSFLETALEQFPADLALERLLTAARALITDGSRTEALATVLESARTFRNQSRFDEALEVLKEGIRVNGQETVLTDFLRVVSLDNEEQRSREKLSRYIRDSVMLLGAGSAAESLAILREGANPVSLSSFARNGARHRRKKVSPGRTKKRSSPRCAKPCLIESKPTTLPGSAGRSLQRSPPAAGFQGPDSDRYESAGARSGRRSGEAHRVPGARDRERDRHRRLEPRPREQRSCPQRIPEQIVFDSLATRISQSQKNAEVEKALSDARELLNKGKLDEAGLSSHTWNRNTARTRCGRRKKAGWMSCRASWPNCARRRSCATAVSSKTPERSWSAWWRVPARAAPLLRPRPPRSSRSSVPNWTHGQVPPQRRKSQRSLGNCVPLAATGFPNRPAFATAAGKPCPKPEFRRRNDCGRTGAWIANRRMVFRTLYV